VVRRQRRAPIAGLAEELVRFAQRIKLISVQIISSHQLSTFLKVDVVFYVVHLIQ
jgi:hypothetical protein